MKTASILRFFYLFVAVHFGLILSCLINLHLEPIKNVHLTTQSDAVLIYGTNELGLSSIRIFKNWNEMEAYLKPHRLSLPKISFAEQGSDIRATLLKSKDPTRSLYYRIFWSGEGAKQSAISRVSFFNSPIQQRENLQKPEFKKVLHAPDADSALAMLQFVKYFKLDPSVMGYSIPLYPELAPSI